MTRPCISREQFDQARRAGVVLVLPTDSPDVVILQSMSCRLVFSTDLGKIVLESGQRIEVEVASSSAVRATPQLPPSVWELLSADD